MALTFHEQIARKAGYPSHLFGFTPNDRAYWVEPGMPWVMPLLNPQHFGLDPVACADELAGLMAFQVWSDNMAPRFATGCFLAGRPLAVGRAVAVGEIIAWLAEGEALDCFELARVAEVGPDWLRVRCDNGGHEQWLTWAAGSFSGTAYRITHYVTQPAPSYDAG